MLLLPYIYRLALLLMSGALWGLIPLLVGKATGKPELGKIGMLCSILTNVIYLGIVSAVGFLIAILVRQEDIGKSASPAAPVNVYYSAPPTAPAQKAVVVEKPVGGLDLFCVSGPLRGQVYPVGPSGLLIGRSPNCSVRLPDGTPGISREHCAIRFQQGVPVLVDLNSTYGTFQGNGAKLPPQYPVQLGPGSRFSLGGNSCVFQLTVR